MAYTGRKTYFKLNGTDVSTYLDSVSGSNNTEELDGTTFQPDVASPTKNILYGFNDKRFSLSGKSSAAALVFFSALGDATDVEYVYGPEGHETGQTRIHGRGNVGKFSGPVNNVSGISTFTLEVSATSQTYDTFDGGSPD